MVIYDFTHVSTNGFVTSVPRLQGTIDSPISLCRYVPVFLSHPQGGQFLFLHGFSTRTPASRGFTRAPIPVPSTATLETVITHSKRSLWAGSHGSDTFVLSDNGTWYD